MEERIDIIIENNGSLEIKTNGLKGEHCIEEVEKIIGKIPSNSKIKKTDEFYQTQKIIAKQKVVNNR